VSRFSWTDGKYEKEVILSYAFLKYRKRQNKYWSIQY